MTLPNGWVGNVVLVGARSNAKGAAMILPGPEGSGPKTILLQDGISFLHSRQLIDILCMQERVFGECRLPAPEKLESAK